MKKYQIIYADPPWEYKDKRTHKSTGMALSAYQTMPIETIKLLPIQKITDKNCILFLWVTFPKLKEGIDVLESWGFKYITVAFVWIKINPTGSVEKIGKDLFIKKGIYSGIGHWTNANAEIVLLGKKGKISRVKSNVKQIILSPRKKHSEKPDDIRNKIIELVGDLPRIELFARKKTPGWDCVGNEIDGKDIAEWINEKL